MAYARRAWIAFTMFLLAAICPAAAEPKRVLLLHSFGPQFVPWVFFAGQFREELFKRSPDKIDLYEASLEGARVQQPDEQGPLVDYLAALFGTRKLDLIVTIGAPATFFVQKYRTKFFPSTPVVIGAPEQRAIDYRALTSNDAPVPVRLDFGKWIEAILQVRPDTTHIAWAVGASPLERFWTEEFRRASQPFAERVSFEWFNDLRFEDMLKRVANLPPHSAVFYVDLRVDAAGVPLDRDLVLPKLREATNAPIFSYIDSYLGQGIVGGPMLSSEDVGRRMAEAAVRILNGEAPSDIKMPPVVPGAAQYDWRELQRWNIREDQLPSGSIVRFREPTVWEHYRTQITLSCALILFQGGLISALLLERRRRHFAEVQSRERMTELAHSNRYSLAGELAATISHEINQPLGAILTNSETMLAMLQSPAPNLLELKEIAVDIHRDDQRAADVVRHLRNLLKKAPLETKDMDFTEPARAAIDFFSALAVAQNVQLNASIEAAPLPIKGNVVQLQQVFLILIVNAMEAMSGLPSDQRMLTITTARAEKFAEASVSDTGPGVPSDKLKEIFSPYFSTKPQGMGMGLSIARTIIEAHSGQIWGENKVDGGAVFHVRLPLAMLPDRRSLAL
jgi:signal transduction histidine kinase